MKIGFIGAGKVGFTLGRLFVSGGLPVIGYYSQQRGSAKEAADFTQTKVFDSLAELVSECDVLFLTVPDGAIVPVYQDLCQFDLSGKQLCHCSGAMSADEAFEGLAARGGEGYSIHPLFPVSNKYSIWQELMGGFFCIEGNNSHINDWKKLLESLGLHVQIIDGSQKVRYHAACAISSNLMCSLVQKSLNLLTSCGFEETFALKALTPLIRSNVSHIITDGVSDALTGPLERCDTKTVQKHMDCFATEEEREMYRLLSKNLLPVAGKKHPDRDYHEMEMVLK